MKGNSQAWELFQPLRFTVCQCSPLVQLKTNGNEQIRECLRESLKTVEKLVIPRRKYIGKVEYHRKPPSERALGPTNRRKKQGGSGRGQQDRRPGTLHLEKQGPSGGRKRGKRYQDNGERAIQRAAEGEESGKKRRKVNGRPGLARGQDGELPPDVQFIEGAPRETPTEVEKGPTSGPTEVAIQRQKTIPTLIESQVDSDGANVDEPEQPEKHPEQPGVDTEVSKQRGVADKGPPSEAALEEEAQQQGIEELQEGMAPPQVEEGGAEEVVRYQQNTGKSGLDTLVAAAFVGGDPKPGKSLDSRPVETGQTEHGQGGRVSPMARRDENLDTPQSQVSCTGIEFSRRVIKEA